jgi:tetratricopeptide (TPR) repeat protein
MRLLPFCLALAAPLLLGTAVASAADLLPPLPKPPVIADQLQATTDGPGPSICEPVAKNTSAATADFGAGCARWLQFALGANVELGQTPRWDAQARGRKELGATDLRLTAAQAARFAKSVGYTHVAVGEISGVPAHCTLSYQLLAMPEQKPVGAPLKATGSEAQVVAALPGMARQLLTLLKVAKPQLPAGALPSPDALQQIGRYAWYPDAAVPDASQKQMEALAAQQPLAGLLTLLHSSLYFPKALEPKCRVLLMQAPGNLMVLSAFSWVGSGLTLGAYELRGAGAAREWVTPSSSRDGLGSALSQAFRDEVDRGVPDRPNNAIIALWRFSEARTLQEQITRSEQAARCSPRNPVSWMQTARLYSNAIQQVRRGKFASMMTEAEVEITQKLSDRAVVLGKKAADLDSDYSQAWAEIAVVATFAGQPALADTALWKAIHLTPDDPRAYLWGLQMYQQKWMAEPEKLAKVAHLAAANRTFLADDAYLVYENLRDGNFAAEARVVLDRAMQGYRAAVRKQPDDAEAHRLLGYRLLQQSQYRDAITEEETALRLDPNSADAHYALEQIYALNFHIDDAISEARETLKLAPNFTPMRANLGMIFEATSKWDEADAEYRKTLEIDPENYQALRGMGFVRQKQNKFDEGIFYFERAIAIEPEAPYPYIMLCFLYNNTNRYDKAIEAGTHAVLFAPTYFLAEEYLGDAYFKKGMYVESIPHFQKAVELNPRTMYSRGQLANADLKLGKKVEAKALLEEIIRLSPNTAYSEEAQRLLKENP